MKMNERAPIGLPPTDGAEAPAMDEIAHCLVVDDDPGCRLAITGLLSRLGFHAVVAEDGSEAIGLMREGSFSFALVDINMPGMDGLEFLLAVRTIARDFPIIAMSGGGRLSATSLLRLAGPLGADFCLCKPFSRDELNVVIGSFLKYRETTRAIPAGRITEQLNFQTHQANT